MLNFLFVWITDTRRIEMYAEENNKLFMCRCNLMCTVMNCTVHLFSVYVLNWTDIFMFSVNFHQIILYFTKNNKKIPLYDNNTLWQQKHVPRTMKIRKKFVFSPKPNAPLLSCRIEYSQLNCFFDVISMYKRSLFFYFSRITRVKKYAIKKAHKP